MPHASKEHTVAPDPNHSEEPTTAKRKLQALIDEGIKITGGNETRGRTRKSTRALKKAAHDDTVINHPADHLSSWNETTFMQPVHSDKMSASERQTAFDKELMVWKMRQAYERIERKSISPDICILGSHTVYRRKDNESLKERIFPWGHKDPARFDLRCDHPCLNPDTFRILLSITVEMNWRIAHMDEEAAFLQGKGFTRKVYIRPPH